MKAPFDVVKDFEDAVKEYTGAPFAVAVNSCTNALFLCLEWKKHLKTPIIEVTIPRYTYISVPMQIKHAGFEVMFSNYTWAHKGYYELEPFGIFDSARLFTSGLFDIPYGPKYQFVCTSHHWNKTLGIQQGGVILHNCADADKWFRRARFDGRSEGIAPSQDTFPMLGWHMYMSPEIAAAGLVRLASLPDHNDPLPADNYPDLSQMEIFK